MIPIRGARTFRAAHDRLGAFLYRGMKRPLEWVEIDFHGNIIGRWTLDFKGSPVAFSKSGNLYRQRNDGIAVFDRASSTWKQIAEPAEGSLLGADGDDLVFKIGDRLRWQGVNSLEQARR